MYSAGTSLYANKDGVFYYETPGGNIVQRSDRQYADPVRNLDGYLGTSTGKSQSTTGKEWIEVEWVNSYSVHGFLGITRGTYNENKVSWVEASNVKVTTTAETEEKAAAEKEAAAQKAKQALIDAVTQPSGSTLTANSGGESPKDYTWWLVGAVLVGVAALVIWKLGKRSKSASVPVPTPIVQRPIKLK